MDMVRLEGDDREAATQETLRLRDEEGLSWAAIAEEIGVNSPSTPRRLYKEAGKNPHGLLPGKGGRTLVFEKGDWCDARCIGALPESPCDCKCGGENHAGGVQKAQSVLKELGFDNDAMSERIEAVERAIEDNEYKLSLTTPAGEE